MRTAAQLQQEQIDRDWNRQQQEALAHIYRKYPSLVKGIAIDRMIVELVSRFFGVEPGTMLVTLYDFELAYAENRTEFEKALATLPPQVQRESVIDDIARLLTPESFRAERGRLSGMSLEALKQRRVQIKLQQRNVLEWDAPSPAPTPSPVQPEPVVLSDGSPQKSLDETPSCSWTKSQLQDWFKRSDGQKKLLQQQFGGGVRGSFFKPDSQVV